MRTLWEGVQMDKHVENRGVTMAQKSKYGMERIKTRSITRVDQEILRTEDIHREVGTI